LTDLGPIQDTNPGSPSAPFATAGERTAWATANLASLLPGRTTAWGPGNVEYMWNGPLATDWELASLGLTTSSVTGRYALAASLGCVALWDFDERAGENWISKVGAPHELKQGVGSAATVDLSDGPVSGRSVVLNGTTDYLIIEGGKIGSLCLSRFGNNVTVLAIAKKNVLDTNGFIAGVWQEDDTEPRRQYGLFLNLGIYGGFNRVCGHISKTGTASPGIPFSRDYSANREQYIASVWGAYAFSYDGATAKSYMYGRFEPVPVYTEPGAPNGQGLTYAKNPYVFPLGLNNSKVGNFTVGSVRVTDGYANFFGGKIAAIAVFPRSLTQQEINKVTVELLRGTNQIAPVVRYPFRWQDAPVQNAQPLSTISCNKTYYGNNCIDGTSSPAGQGFMCARPTSVDAYLYRINTVAASKVFWMDEQSFGIPAANIKKFSVLMHHNQPSTTLTKICVRVAGVWWAINPGIGCNSVHESGADWTTAELKNLTVTPETIVTQMVVDPGVTLGETANTATWGALGDVDAIGMYVPSMQGGGDYALRYRDLFVYV
jgi:hypothetical protein